MKFIKTGKRRCSFESMILSVYLGAFVSGKVKIDGGFERSTHLYYISDWRRRGYTEYRCYGVSLDISLFFFRIGIYFTPFCFKQKNRNESGYQ